MPGLREFPAIPRDLREWNRYQREAFQTPGFTVAQLTALGGKRGDRAVVVDATAPIFLGTLTGGGSVVTPAFHNGTTWVSA